MKRFQKLRDESKTLQQTLSRFAEEDVNGLAFEGGSLVHADTKADGTIVVAHHFGEDQRVFYEVSIIVRSAT